MAKEFVLTITLGNDTMQTPKDVGLALLRVAATMMRGETHGAIQDDNGNTVGRFEVNRTHGGK